MPVLLKRSIDYLVTNPDGIYVDGTLGGGGHSSEILSRLSQRGKLISFDKDTTAVKHCQERFSAELALGAESRLVIENQCYSEAANKEEIRGLTQGILLDLGVSSRQLDESHRGFSYRFNARLDMKFASDGRSAEDILNAAAEDELEHILRNYGEEPFAKVIARRIVQARRAAPLLYTFDLRDVVEQSVPQQILLKSLSRVFQAIRIAVNKELEVLEYTLSNLVPILAKGGRAVIISYHSLEDRLVKEAFRRLSQPERDEITGRAIKEPLMKLITRKPELPDAAEVAINLRARSAKLRVAEKN